MAPLAVLCAWPAPGAAFCRTTTVETTVKCQPQCQTEGYPLYWPQRHITYQIDERGFPELSEDTLREALDDSFGAWLDVECGARPIDLRVDQAAATGTFEPRSKGSPNLIVHLSAEEWAPYDATALAITTMRYDQRNGHILAADMLFNGGRGTFGVCSSSGCEPGTDIDLPNVITHEAGHFFGLAHSQDVNATMWCDSAPDDISMRTLEPDDVAGICAIYGPNPVLGPPPQGVAKASGLLCSALRPASDRGPPGWLGLGLVGGLGWLLGRRRR